MRGTLSGPVRCFLSIERGPIQRWGLFFTGAGHTPTFAGPRLYWGHHGCWLQQIRAGRYGVGQTGNSRRKKSKAMPAGAPEIPDKLYFRIGEVARLLGIAPYVLRFWESEFPQLHPNKGGTGQRLYRRRDVETAQRIKRLLYDEGYTIPGARQMLKAEARASEPRVSELRTAELRAAEPRATELHAAEPHRSEPKGGAAQLVSGTQAVPAEERLRRLRSDLTEIAGILAGPVPGARRGASRPEGRLLHMAHRRGEGSAAAVPDALSSGEVPEES